MLPRVAGRPPDFQLGDVGVFAQADVLLEWRGSERSSAANRATNRPRSLSHVFDRHFDPCSNRPTIGFCANQLQVDPVIAVAWVLEHTQRVTIAVGRAPHLGDDVLVAVVAEIGEGDAVSLVQLACARPLSQ